MSLPSIHYYFRYFFTGVVLSLLMSVCAIEVSASTEIQDTILSSNNDSTIAATEIKRLTDDDYRAVAEQLNIEIAAIKAVVEIEAGHDHRGFLSPGKPIINFDLSMFRRFATRRGISLAKYSTSHAEVFNRPDSHKHGSYQKAQHARLRKAREISQEAAIEGTFWGMFQIGGFNWKKCGASSIHDFVESMSRSERDQLDLFITFITNTGLLQHLRSKNWSAFARGYNGANYARQRYHTRLAASYAKHKRK